MSARLNGHAKPQRSAATSRGAEGSPGYHAGIRVNQSPVVPMELTRLQTRVAREIVAFARRENLKAGSHLAESLLADQIGTSRSPVNVALRHLAETGMLSHDLNRGFFLNKDALSFDELARLCGFPGKLGMDGSQVWPAYRDGKLAEIRDYCETDVANTWLMYCRFQLMRGVFSPEQFDHEVDLLRSTLAAQPGAHWREYLAAWPRAART